MYENDKVLKMNYKIINHLCADKNNDNLFVVTLPFVSPFASELDEESVVSNSEELSHLILLALPTPSQHLH